MTKTIFKRAFLVFIAVFVLMSSFSISFADKDFGSTSITINDQIKEGKSRLTEGTDPVSKSLQDLANVLMWAAFGISVVKLAQIGLQMMLNSGKKSKAKESLIPWAIGVAICCTYLIIGPWIMHLIGDPLESTGPFDIGWF